MTPFVQTSRSRSQRTVDLALSKLFGLNRLGAGRGTVELRAEVFNLLKSRQLRPAVARGLRRQRRQRSSSRVAADAVGTADQFLITTDQKEKGRPHG